MLRYAMMAMLAIALANPAMAKSIKLKKKKKKREPSPIGVTLDMRHYTNVKMEKDEQERVEGKQEIRSVFSTTAIKDLYLGLVLGITKKTGEPGAFYTKRPYMIADYTLLSSSFYRAYTGGLVALPNENSQGQKSNWDGAIWAGQSFFTSVKSPFGKLNPSLTTNFGIADLSSDGKDATVENGTGQSAQELGIDGEDNDDKSEITIKDGETDLTYTTEYLADLSYVPYGFRKKLSMSVGTGMNQKYAPKYEVAAAQSSNIKRTYPVETETHNSFKIKYKLTKKASFANELYQTFDGVYGSSRNASNRGSQNGRHRWQNVFKFNYTL